MLDNNLKNVHVGNKLYPLFYLNNALLQVLRFLTSNSVQ